MPRRCPEVRGRCTSLLAFLGSLFVTGILFYGIPLAQHFERHYPSEAVAQPVTVRASPTIAPLPARLPPAKIPETTTERSQEIPALDLRWTDTPDQSFVVKVSPKKVATDALVIELPTARIEPDFIRSIQKVSTFDDLSTAPRLINAPPYRFPPDLRRQGVESGNVVVQIRILPDGNAEFIRIVSSSHRELNEVVREIISRARFTPPQVDGTPRTVIGTFPLQLEG